MEHKILQWHPAPSPDCKEGAHLDQAALQIELSDDAEALQFLREYNLTEKPLQIDTLVIRQDPGQTVQKSIGHIFRRYNVVEYKNPGDYISVNDFYKVLSYTCIYQANTEKVLEILPEELTITFIANRYPRKMIKHLKVRYGATVERYDSGI